MKSSRLILALWLAVAVWAQGAPRPTVPSKSAKPVAVTPAKQAPGNTASPAAAAPAAKTAPAPAAKAAAKPAPAAKKPSARVKHKPAETARPVHRTHPAKQAPAASNVAGKPTMDQHGRRDPFVSPVVPRMEGGPVCTGSGRKCLAVGDISLHGVVHSQDGYIAVVQNEEHTYFLRDNDPLANGTVERITSDAIVMREHSSDAMGRPVTREVVKKIGAPAL